MPFVSLQYRNPITKANDLMLSKRLPGIVARALSDSEDKLDPSDVEVEVRKIEKDDISHFDLHIVVQANEHEERMKNLNERRNQIVDELKVIIEAGKGPLADRKFRGFVWLRLCPGSFLEF